MRSNQGWRPLLGFTMGCVLAIAICPLQSIAADWKEQLLVDAPPKWTSLEEYYSKMEASFRKVFAVPSEGSPFPLAFQGTIYYDTRQNGEMMVSTHHHVGKDGNGKQVDDTIVRGVNSRYAFNLGKTSPATKAFVLANFEPVNNKARQKVHGSGGGAYDMVFKTVNGVRLIDLIKDPLLTFRADGVQRKGKEMVQLEYDRKLANRDRNDQSQTKAAGTEHGIIVLDPEHFWCVHESHLDALDWKHDAILDYGTEVDGFLILHRFRQSSTHKKMGSMVITDEFDNLVHRDIPEGEFTLSAFGLPEVQIPGEQSPRTMWRWLIGFGIAFGVLAILLLRYVKKRQRAPQSA